MSLILFAKQDVWQNTDALNPELLNNPILLTFLFVVLYKIVRSCIYGDEDD